MWTNGRDPIASALMASKLLKSMAKKVREDQTITDISKELKEHAKYARPSRGNVPCIGMQIRLCPFSSTSLVSAYRFLSLHSGELPLYRHTGSSLCPFSSMPLVSTQISLSPFSSTSLVLEHMFLPLHSRQRPFLYLSILINLPCIGMQVHLFPFSATPPVTAHIVLILHSRQLPLFYLSLYSRKKRAATLPLFFPLAISFPFFFLAGFSRSAPRACWTRRFPRTRRCLRRCWCGRWTISTRWPAWSSPCWPATAASSATLPARLSSPASGWAPWPWTQTGGGYVQLPTHFTSDLWLTTRDFRFHHFRFFHFWYLVTSASSGFQQAVLCWIWCPSHLIFVVPSSS